MENTKRQTFIKIGPLEWQGKSKYVESYHKLAGIGTGRNNDRTYKTTIKPIKFHLECMPEEKILHIISTD